LCGVFADGKSRAPEERRETKFGRTVNQKDMIFFFYLPPEDEYPTGKGGKVDAYSASFRVSGSYASLKTCQDCALHKNWDEDSRPRGHQA